MLSTELSTKDSNHHTFHALLHAFHPLQDLEVNLAILPQISLLISHPLNIDPRRNMTNSSAFHPGMTYKLECAVPGNIAGFWCQSGTK